MLAKFCLYVFACKSPQIQAGHRTSVTCLSLVLQSVVNYEVAPPEGVCHWQVHLEDAESANLLAELPAAVTWLERAMRQKGCKVLVHCNAGRQPMLLLLLMACIAYSKSTCSGAPHWVFVLPFDLQAVCEKKGLCQIHVHCSSVDRLSQVDSPCISENTWRYRKAQQQETTPL